MNIKHLVLPGGGSNFFTFYGIVKQLHIENIWKYDTLSSIHCTSSGSILAFIILLKMDWNIIDNYIINRPWDTVYTITPEMCLDIFQSKGFVNIDFLYVFANPLLKTVEWSNQITLKELYEVTNIDLYIYVTNYTTMTPYCFHHITDPDIPLFHAIYMSSSLPLLAQPLAWKDTYYIDGGLYNNNPIQPCVDLNNIDEILSFKVIYSNNNETINFQDQNIVIYMQELITRFIRKFKEQHKCETLTTYQIDISVPNIWDQSWEYLLSSADARSKSMNDVIPLINAFIKQHE